MGAQRACKWTEIPDCAATTKNRPNEARLAKGSRIKMWSHPHRPAAKVSTDVVTSGRPAARSRRNVVTLAVKAIHAPGRRVWRGIDGVCRYSGRQGATLRVRPSRRQG